MKKFMCMLLSILLLSGLCVQTAWAGEPLVFAQSEITLEEGKTTVLTLSSGAREGLKWKSSNRYVVKLNQKGKILAAGGGQATVTVTAPDGETASCVVTVPRTRAEEPLGPISPGRFWQEDGLWTNGKESDQAVLLFTGDLMALTAQQKTAYKKGVYNFNSSFTRVRGLFSRADFVMGNLETSLSYSAPYMHEQVRIDGLPNCNAPGTYLDALRYAGFDAVATANNHCLDGGRKGLFETLEALERYQLAHTGCFSGPRQPYLMVQVNGIKIALLAYSETFNGWEAGLTPEEREGCINLYSKEKAEQDAAAARAAGAELVMAYMHWGKNFKQTVNARQKAQAQELADAGVDVILGAHPHVLQPAQLLRAADGRRVLCVYSLGNFVSSAEQKECNDTVILRLVVKRTDGQVKLAQARYIPCQGWPRLGEDRYVVTPIGKGPVNSLMAASRYRITQAMGNTLRPIYLT